MQTFNPNKQKFNPAKFKSKEDRVAGFKDYWSNLPKAMTGNEAVDAWKKYVKQGWTEFYIISYTIKTEFGLTIGKWVSISSPKVLTEDEIREAAAWNHQHNQVIIVQPAFWYATETVAIDKPFNEYYEFSFKVCEIFHSSPVIYYGTGEVVAPGDTVEFKRNKQVYNTVVTKVSSYHIITPEGNFGREQVKFVKRNEK